MPEYVTRNDYAAGLELAATHGQRRHDADLLEDPRPRQSAARLALRAGPRLRRRSTGRAGPFNTNGAAIAAGIASIADLEHEAKSVAHNAHWLEWLSTEISALGIKVTPSVGNFILLHFADAATAQRADAYLSARGLILRAVRAYGLPACLRCTVGTEEANRLVVQSLAAFMKTGAAAGA